MKRLLIASILLFLSAPSFADICYKEGKVFSENCQVVGEKPNLLVGIEWPTQRTDNTDLALSEIDYAKIYFKELQPEGKYKWTEYKLATEFTALHIEKPVGEWKVLSTVMDTGGRESKPGVELSFAIEEAVASPTPPPSNAPTKPLTRFTITITVTENPQ